MFEMDFMLLHTQQPHLYSMVILFTILGRSCEARGLPQPSFRLGQCWHFDYLILKKYFLRFYAFSTFLEFLFL